MPRIYRWCVLPGLECITKRCLNVKVNKGRLEMGQLPEESLHYSGKKSFKNLKHGRAI